ncbi:MAG: tRNA guanosine(34) transglycosylase Tgt [Candidatus Saccharibacteria bacterium]|nr:tRNA guanosine(34) transglycosylase Tgt [Candidatus Saccharibacteria bacterium]
MSQKAIDFKIIQKTINGRARVGEISTPHGIIKTPSFMVAATKATVKAMLPETVRELGGQAILANTYHLMLQPGEDIIAQAGGLAEFSNWHGPSITDSGGFQVFSLGMAYEKGLENTLASQATHSKKQLAKVDDEGVTFRSHLDGRIVRLTPERSMEIQHKIGADIHMAFDELTSPSASPEYVKRAMDRTHTWAKRCLIRHQQLNEQHLQNKQPLQALFAVVQGGQDSQLRQISAETLGAMDFDGYGIGGTFKASEIEQFTGLVTKILPEAKPRHLLGMGAQPLDIFLGIENGVDTLDCVAPTRQARNGSLYTVNGRINIKNAKYKNDFSPIDSNLDYHISQTYTKAYLHHLFKADEILASMLASMHNEFFVINLTDKIRQALLDDSYEQFKTDFLRKYYHS